MWLKLERDNGFLETISQWLTKNGLGSDYLFQLAMIFLMYPQNFMKKTTTFWVTHNYSCLYL